MDPVSNLWFCLLQKGYRFSCISSPKDRKRIKPGARFNFILVMGKQKQIQTKGGKASLVGHTSVPWLTCSQPTVNMFPRSERFIPTLQGAQKKMFSYSHTLPFVAHLASGLSSQRNGYLLSCSPGMPLTPTATQYPLSPPTLTLWLSTPS